MFFIFGMPRSGTTLLAQSLSAHSEIVIPDETDFIIPMTFIFDRINDKEIGRELIYKLIINTTGFSGSIGEYLPPPLIRSLIYSCEYHPASILNAIYAEIAATEQVKIAGDKSPNDLNFLRMLVKTGGISADMKIIHIVRDIRDLMVSLNKTGWVSDLDLYAPRFWCNNNLYLNNIYHENKESYLFIRYEDLVSSPENEFESICHFLNVQYEPDMLAPENRNDRHKQTAVHSNLYKSISNRSVGRYKDILDHDTLTNYETQAGEALRAFGYMT